jgi:Methyltransferase domain
MNQCRNCGGMELQELGFIGKLVPFFLKRVFGMRVGAGESPSPLKALVQKTTAAPRALLNRVSQPTVFVEMQICDQCSFIQTRMPFEEQAINRLYLDYRSDSYNRERIEYEPAYAAIAEDVGQHAQELEARVTAATNFMQGKVPTGADFTILDYGGADGKFLPRLEGKKFVFEISNIEPIAGVTRVHSEEEMGTYSLVQLTHVIEHVVQPLELVKRVGAKVAPGGFLYLETPQELTDEKRAGLKSGSGRNVAIHEHINSYCVPAVTKLIENAGFRLVAIEATRVDVGWGNAVHIRALGQKT